MYPHGGSRMAMGRPKKPLVLTEEEQEKLEA